MPLPIAKIQALSDLAQHLYEYLPGTPHPMADQRISFEGVARRCGVAGYWSGGSKLPAINALLEQTLERQPKKFCGLIVEVVRKAIVYRARKNPLKAGDLATLHGLVYRVGFRLKDLENTEAFG